MTAERQHASVTVTAAGARRPGLWRCLLAGLVSGVLATVLAVPLAGVLQAAVGRRYEEELSAGHLAQATVLSTVLGGALFYAAARWTARPVRVFAVVVVGFAVAYSVVVAIAPPAPGFAAVVAPLHVLVAAVTVAVVHVSGERLWTRRPVARRGYVLIAAGLVGLLMVMFVAVEVLDVPLLTDPGPWLGEPGVLAAVVGTGLLVVDVVLPVPSSAVMVAHGALFGVVGGTVLSLVGGLGATLVAFGIGRRSQVLVDRLVSPDERARAERWLSRYGPLAIVVTRPVPILAETTAIIAGTSHIRWRWAAAAGAAGNVAPAALYAASGAVVTSLTSQAVVFGVVLAIAAGFWLLGRRARPSATIPTSDADGAPEPRRAVT